MQERFIAASERLNGTVGPQELAAYHRAIVAGDDLEALEIAGALHPSPPAAQPQVPPDGLPGRDAAREPALLRQRAVEPDRRSVAQRNRRAASRLQAGQGALAAAEGESCLRSSSSAPAWPAPRQPWRWPGLASGRIMLDVGHTDGRAPRVGRQPLRPPQAPRHLRPVHRRRLPRRLRRAAGRGRRRQAERAELRVRHAGRRAALARRSDRFRSRSRALRWAAWATPGARGCIVSPTADLAGFPIREADLTPYFDLLTQEIGISGADDDLTPFFGEAAGLQPPLRLSYNADKLYRSYRRKREALRRRGVFIGRPRLGVLSEAKEDRPAVRLQQHGVLAGRALPLHPSRDAEKAHRRRASGLPARPAGAFLGRGCRGRDGRGGGDRVGPARPVPGGCVAAGRRRHRHEQDRPAEPSATSRRRCRCWRIPPCRFPLCCPRPSAGALDKHAFGLTQLNLIWQSAALGCTVQGSLLELTSPMRAEFFGRFPLSAQGNLALVAPDAARDAPHAVVLPWLRSAAGQVVAARGRRPAHPGPPERGRRAGAGRPARPALRRVGLWTLPMLIQKPVTGHAIHYAATLPMAESPGRYQCHPNGRLSGTQRVYIADSACFSDLPAKNMSFGMMANAMRVAELMAR